MKQHTKQTQGKLPTRKFALLAAIALGASLLAVVPAQPLQAQAQIPFLTFTNTGTAPSAAATGSRDVQVFVNPIGGCNPGEGAIAADGYTLSLGGTQPVLTLVTGIISTNCNYEVTYRTLRTDCLVTAKVFSDRAATVQIGSDILGRPIIISGSPGATPLRYNGQAAIVIQFEADETDCGSSFTPVPNITISNGDASKYSGLEIKVSYTPSSTSTGSVNSCTRNAEATYAVGRNGLFALKAGTQAPSLIDQTRLDRAAGVTRFCAYSVSFQAESGALRLQSGDTTRPTSVIDNSATTFNVQANPRAVYSSIMVQIKVRMTYPISEVYNTLDRVTYYVTLERPCGGYIDVLPEGLGTQSDATERQVWPGTLLVYGSELDAITVQAPDPRRYSVTAYEDALGTQPCSVTVTEVESVTRCPTVGENSQTKTYVPETETLEFEFEHVCISSLVADGDDGGNPPVPPEVLLGSRVPSSLQGSGAPGGSAAGSAGSSATGGLVADGPPSPPQVLLDGDSTSSRLDVVAEVPGGPVRESIVG